MIRFLVLTLVLAAFSPQLIYAKIFSEREEVIEFIDKISQKHKLDKSKVLNSFAKLESSDKVLQLISNPREALPWDKYRDLLLSKRRIEEGAKFWKQNAKFLEKAEQAYGIPQNIIVAIIGAETFYGENKGSFPVLQALATLSFDYPKRSKFFISELENYLVLCRDHNLDLLELKGSYAGAIGIPQFMPSSYKHYADDLEGGKSINLMLNNNQAIYSVGSFLKKHHWKSGKDIIVPAKLKNKDYTKLQIAKTNYPKPNLSLQTLQANGVEPATTNNFKQDDKVAFIEMVKSDGAEYWVGSDNFFVITRYNNSNNYALYVYLLSEEIKKSYNA